MMVITNYLQYISLGPDVSKISPLLSDITNLSNVDLLWILSFQRGLLEIILYTIFSVCITWVGVVIVHCIGIDNRFRSLSIFKCIALMENNLVPLIGNAGFQPALSILLSVFVCNSVKGKDSIFEDSVLSVDCTQHCWTTQHIVYCVISSILVMIFTGIVVYLKPKWQSEISAELHILKTPYIMLLETLLQVYFVVVDKVIKRSYKLVHSIMFIIPLSIFLCFTFIKDSYNYKRVGLWQQMSLTGVIWIAVLATIQSNMSSDIGVPWYVLLLIGWSVIVIIGIYLMCKKYPNYLTVSTKDISQLFRFQLTSSMKRENNSIVPINSTKIPEIQNNDPFFNQLQELNKLDISLSFETSNLINNIEKDTQKRLKRSKPQDIYREE